MHQQLGMFNRHVTKQGIGPMGWYDSWPPTVVKMVQEVFTGEDMLIGVGADMPQD